MPFSDVGNPNLHSQLEVSGYSPALPSRAPEDFEATNHEGDSVVLLVSFLIVNWERSCYILFL